ncbi:unnamed protein product, partial [Aphanomyces euteiches]
MSPPSPPPLFAITDTPSLTRGEIHDIVTIALRNAEALVTYIDINRGPVEWTLDGNHTDYRIYKGEEPALYTRTPTSGLYCSSMEITGTLDEVVELFRTETTLHAHEHSNGVGRGFVDGVTLATLPVPVDSTMENIAIKWYLAKTAFQGLVRPRDACVVECDHAFELNGKHGWVRAFKSIQLISCPDLEATMGYIRMEDLGSGHVFIETDRPRCLQAYYISHMDLKGHTPEWLAKAAHKQICKTNLLDVDRFLRENRLSEGHWLYPEQVVPLDDRKKCFRCRAPFRFLRSKANCRKCGQVVCSHCSEAWHVQVEGVPRKMRACYVCSLKLPEMTGNGIDGWSAEMLQAT